MSESQSIYGNIGIASFAGVGVRVHVGAGIAISVGRGSGIAIGQGVSVRQRTRIRTIDVTAGICISIGDLNIGHPSPRRASRASQRAPFRETETPSPQPPAQTCCCPGQARLVMVAQQQVVGVSSRDRSCQQSSAKPLPQHTASTAKPRN